MIKRFYFLLTCFLTLTLSASAQFTALNGPPGGTINDLEFDPSTLKVYSVVNNNLYVSSNDGTAWSKIVPTTPTNLYVNDFMIDGSTLFALYYYQLFSSTDGGANWTLINANGSFDGAYKVIKVGTGVYAVYGYNGVYVSKDAGVTWTQISTAYTTSAVASGTGDLYFVDSGGIKKHLNPGTNPWAASNVVTILADANDYYGIKLAVLGSSIFATVGTGQTITSANDILKYNGSTWVSAKSGITDTYFLGGTWANSSAGLYFFNSYNNDVWFTSAGTSWTAAGTWPSANFSSYSVSDVRFASATKAFAGTQGDGVFLTTNTGTSWSLASGGINLGNGQDVVVGTGSPARVIVRTGYSSKGFWYSDDKGVTWTFKNSQLNSIGRLTKLQNGSLIGLNGGPVEYSADNGATWTYSGSGSDYFSYLAFNTTFNATYNYGIASNRLASTTTGATWTTITVTGLPTSYGTYGLAQDNAGALYASVYNYNNSSYEFYKIVLAGNVASATTATATLLTVPLIPADLPPNYFYLTGMVVNNNKLYIGSNNAIYYSADQGATWNSSVFSNNAVTALPNGNGICASTYGALYVTSDDGKSWSDNAMPSSDGYIQALAYDAGTGSYYAAGYNTPALKNVTTSLLPASPPPYINFNWAATNGPWGQSISNILVDNANNTFALTNNAYIYKTTNFSSWSDITQGTYNFYAADIDKPNNKIYAVGYGQIYTSISGGSWTKVTTGSEAYGWSQHVKLCSNGDLVLSSWDSNGNVFVSTNGGASFGAAKYTANNYIYDIQVTSTATPGIFVIYYDANANTTKVVKSVDRGVTWTTLTTPGTNVYTISGVGSVLYARTWSSTGGDDINASTDNGTTWTSIKGDLPSSGCCYQSVYKSPAGDLYLMGQNGSDAGFYKSSNGGTNWTFLKVPTSPNTVNWVGTRMVVGTYLGVMYSDDGGMTYTTQNTGIPQSNLSDIELASQSKLYVSTGNQDFYSTDFQNWTADSNYSFVGFTHKPDGSVLAFDNSRLYKTLDGGNTWLTISSTLPYLNNIATADGTTYYGTNWPSTIYYSSDLNTWTQLSPTGFPSNFQLYDIAVDQNGIYYVVLYNNSTQANEAYQILFGSAIKIVQAKNPQNVEFSQNKIFLYDGNGSVLTTTDGSSWTKNAAPAGNKLIIASQNYYFIPAYGGNLWLSRDQGQTWQNVGLGGTSSNFNFNDVAINEFNGYAYGAITNSPVRKSGNIVIPNDGVAPSVTSLSPVLNATGVSVKPALSITFDRGALPVAGKYLRILDVANPVTPVEIIDVSLGVQNGRTFTFTPVNFLGFNKTYFIVVDNGAFTNIFLPTPAAWGGITSNSTWKFTTKSTPTLNTLSPANNATGVSLNPSLTMTFSDVITPATGKNIYIYDASQTSSPVATIAIPNLTNDFAQITPITASPDQVVTVTFDATKGGGELIGATSVYMHAGVITDSPTGTSWQNVVGNYGLDDGIGKMTAVSGSPNLWQITLSPTLRQYFSVASGTSVYSLAMVFRNSDGSRKATPPATMTGGYFAPNGDSFLSLGTTIQPGVSAVGNSVTIVPNSNLKYYKQYFVKTDATSFNTVEGFGLSFDVNNTDWVFTTLNYPDTKPPVIKYAHDNSNPDNINKGAGSKTISVGITDSVSVAAAKIFYRRITSTNPVDSAALTLNGSNYEISIPETTYGTIGLEYYFTAVDPSNNKARSPSGATKYYSYINYATGSSSTNPALPSLPSGGDVGNWKVISIPYQLADPAVTTIFNELGTPDKSAWRLITYKNQSAWAEYPSDFTTIKQGTGYFINVKNSGSILIEGASSPNYTKESPFTVNLNSGWSEIGNPYPFAVTWTEVLAASNLVSSGPTLKTFNGTYTAATALNAFEGGFVFNSGTSPVTLTFPITAAASGGRKAAQERTDLDGEEWVAPIALTIDGITSDLGGVGMNPLASKSVDNFDDVTPPRFIDFLEMNFPHPEHFAKNLDRDVVPTQSEYTWDFSVDSNLKGLATLSWDNTAFGNGNKDLILFDEALQQPINMRELSRYQFDPNESKTFKVYFGDNMMDKIKPSKVFVGKAYPNPTAGIAAINFTLPESNADYNVNLEIFDIMGNRVSTVVNKNFRAGFYSSEWDSSLSNSSNGMYIFRFVVNSPTGSETHAGKIILKK
jgi:hypothetical protein